MSDDSSIEQSQRAFGSSPARSHVALDTALRAYRTRAVSPQAGLPRLARVQPGLRAYTGLEHLLNLLAPACCALCDTEVRGVQEPICTRCESALQSRITALDFGDVWSPFQHANQARRAVSRLKYYGERWRGFQLAQFAGLSWLAAFEDAVDRNDVLVPIPLTDRRIRQRGFNQAQVLVQGIQRRVKIRRCTRTLYRHGGDDRDQKRLNRSERLQRANPFGAHTHLAPGTRVWIVDDVITTGTTLEQAAECLVAVGLCPVGAITLTWTP